MTRILLVLLLAAACNVAGELDPRNYEERCADLYASKYGVQIDLVRAIIDVESRWQPGAVSNKGAIGLMQLMPATAREYGTRHPFWIHENIRGGVAYLRSLLDEFHGDLRLSVAAYYAGSRRIRARGLAYADRPVFEYVQAVAARYREELRRRAE
ncbi:MAG: lytic transglycosylase domain-containing protein [Bryobacteraceae bacterium]